jgi:hypothetical protein
MTDDAQEDRCSRDQAFNQEANAEVQKFIRCQSLRENNENRNRNHENG